MDNNAERAGVEQLVFIIVLSFAVREIMNQTRDEVNVVWKSVRATSKLELVSSSFTKMKQSFVHKASAANWEELIVPDPSVKKRIEELGDQMKV